MTTLALTFADIEQRFIDRVHQMVWCSIATVDAAGRPHVRIVHTIWEGGTGWAVTRRGTASPGIQNSWPKWAPSATDVGAKRYYWLTFSSTRRDGTPQLYVTPVIMGADGAITTASSLYLWNQPADQSNHTPAWDVFKIPPATVK